jgi:hypothetical protein
VLSGCSSILIPSFHVFQLYAQDGSLDGVEAAVPSNFLMHVAARATVIAQPAHMRRHFEAVGGYRASLTIGAEILRRIKAERCRDAH